MPLLRPSSNPTGGAVGRSPNTQPSLAELRTVDDAELPTRFRVRIRPERELRLKAADQTGQRAEDPRARTAGRLFLGLLEQAAEARGLRTGGEELPLELDDPGIDEHATETHRH